MTNIDRFAICDRRHFRICLTILIPALMVLSLFDFHLLQGIAAQLPSESKFYLKMKISDNHTSTQGKYSSFVSTSSLYKNFSEGEVRQYSISNSSSNNAIVLWNQLLTGIGLQKNIPAPYLARDYALMHVAIYDALLQLANENNNNNISNSDNIEKPAMAVAVVASAAAEVLAYLFPENYSSIAALEEQQITTHIQELDTLQFIDGWTIGKVVGKKVIEYAKVDGSNIQWNTTTMPSGPGKWTGTNPIGPTFGYQKTYLLSSGAEFQPPPPYPFGSPKDLAEVQAVIDAAQFRTPEKIAIVHKWADLPPPTIWNNMLNDLIENQNLTTYESARASAYLNTAMYDSFVSCWYTKFTYWTARPFQRITISDPAFTTVIPTPNFPSYASGHSTISSAASLILGHLFPDKALYFLSEAHEAAMSRLWGGIHFPQDNDNGFEIGQQIGKKYVNDMLRPPHAFVVSAGKI